MSPVLEAKWREFNESNPYNREKDASEDEAKSATEGNRFIDVHKFHTSLS